MRNVLLDKESKNAETLLKLDGVIEGDYVSGFDATSQAQNALKVSTALNEGAFSLGNTALELYETNKVMEVDADIKRTWYEFDLAEAQNPEARLTKEGIEAQSKLRRAYKERIDEHVIDQNINADNRNQFLENNNDRYRSSELDSQRAVFEMRLQREVKNAENYLLTNRGSASQTFNDKSKLFTTDSETQKLNGDPNFAIGVDYTTKSYIDNGAQSSKTLDKMNDNHLTTMGNVKDTTSTILVGKFDDTLRELDTMMSNPTETTGDEFSSSVDTILASLEDGNVLDKTVEALLAEQFDSIGHGYLSTEEKEDITLSVHNYVSEFKKDKKLELNNKKKEYIALENTAANKLDAYTTTNDINFKNDNSEILKAVDDGYTNNNDIRDLNNVITGSAYGFIDGEMANQIYVGNGVRLVNLEVGELSTMATNNKSYSEAGDYIALDNMYGDLYSTIDEYAKDQEKRGLSTYDKAFNNYNATVHESEDGLQTGINGSILKLKPGQEKNQIIRNESYIKIATAQDLPVIEHDTSDFRKLAKPARNELAKLGITTRKDMDIYIRNQQLVLQGKNKSEGGDDSTLSKSYLFDENSSLYNLATELIESPEGKIVNVKMFADGTDIIDIYRTTEYFEKDRLNMGRISEITMDRSRIGKLYDDEPLWFSGDTGREVLARGYTTDDEERSKLRDEILNSDGYINSIEPDETKEAMLDSITKGYASDAKIKETIESHEQANVEAINSIYNDQDDRITKKFVDRLDSTDLSDEYKDLGRRLIMDNDFSVYSFKPNGSTEEEDEVIGLMLDELISDIHKFNDDETTTVTIDSDGDDSNDDDGSDDLKSTTTSTNTEDETTEEHEPFTLDLYGKYKKYRNNKNLILPEDEVNIDDMGDIFNSFGSSNPTLDYVMDDPDLQEALERGTDLKNTMIAYKVGEWTARIVATAGLKYAGTKGAAFVTKSGVIAKAAVQGEALVKRADVLMKHGTDPNLKQATRDLYLKELQTVNGEINKLNDLVAKEMTELGGMAKLLNFDKLQPIIESTVLKYPWAKYFLQPGALAATIGLGGVYVGTDTEIQAVNFLSNTVNLPEYFTSKNKMSAVISSSYLELSDDEVGNIVDTITDITLGDESVPFPERVKNFRLLSENLDDLSLITRRKIVGEFKKTGRNMKDTGGDNATLKREVYNSLGVGEMKNRASLDQDGSVEDIVKQFGLNNSDLNLLRANLKKLERKNK